MYVLPQAGILAQQLLENRLNDQGYFQNTLVPGLWKHNWRPVQCTLVVNKFRRQICWQRTRTTPSQRNQWALRHQGSLGRRQIHWYQARLGFCQTKIHVSMPGYIVKALLHLHHPQPKTPRLAAPTHECDLRHQATIRGSTQQNTFFNKDRKLFIQQTSRNLLNFGRTVDPTILTVLSTIAAQQLNLTMDTMRKAKQLLDYVVTQEEAIIAYSPSNMVLDSTQQQVI